MDLARFKLEGLLGEGADLQVFSATDTATGDAVVLKRPHPTLVQRGQHGDVEGSLLHAKALRDRPRSALPHLAQMIGHGRQSTGESYFGDRLENSYIVAVERRARGLPLVGSASDAVKGMPVGLPQNLFVRHPVVPRRSGSPFTIATDLLDSAEAFLRAGHLLLDLRPQNVFFDPRSGSIEIVDLGGVVAPRQATRSRPQLDFHDVIVEMMRWYLPALDAPATADGYRLPHLMDAMPSFAGAVEGMLEACSKLASGGVRDATLRILEITRQRGYEAFGSFRRDFDRLLHLMADHYAELAGSKPVVDAWTEALAQLRQPAWSKFLFAAQKDLEPYQVV